MQCLVEETQNSLNSKCELSTSSETGTELPCGYSVPFPTSLIFSFIFYDSLCCACSSQDSSLLALLQYMQTCSYFRNFLLFFLFPLWDLPIQPKNNFSPKSWVYLLLAQCFIYDSNSYHFLIFSIITSTFFLVIFFLYMEITYVHKSI